MIDVIAIFTNLPASFAAGYLIGKMHSSKPITNRDLYWSLPAMTIAIVVLILQIIGFSQQS